MSIFLNHPCEKCNAATPNEQNEFAEYICDDCDQNVHEAAMPSDLGDGLPHFNRNE